MSKQSIVMGKNAVSEAIKAKRTIEKIYLIDTQKGTEFARVCERVASTEFKSSKELQKYGDKNGGVVALVKEYELKELNEVLTKLKDQTDSTLVMLDSLEDPHNLGAILRSADASQMDAIIIPKHRSVGLNETVARVSTGAIEYVDVVEVVNLAQTIDNLKKHGYWIIGLEADGSKNFREQDYSGKIVVVLGSEGKGISRLVKEKCDFLVNIPMYGHVNSLNVSVSAALLFYEILRKRGK